MPAIRHCLCGPGCRAGWLFLLPVVLTVTAESPGADVPEHTLGHPGYLVIAGAARADTGSPFAWQSGPGPDQRSLVWKEGMLTIPVGLTPETFGPDDLAVPCDAGLAGGGNTGRMVFRPGRYPVSEPVVLTDGMVTLYVAGGDLEIVGERVRYRATSVVVRDPRAPYILLAGLVLLTLVLLRRARRGFARGRER